MSLPDQGSMMRCHCCSQFSAGDTCHYCGATIQNDYQPRTSLTPPWENQRSRTTVEVVDPPAPLMGPYDDPSLIGQSNRSGYNAAEEPTSYVHSNQSNPLVFNTPEAKTEPPQYMRLGITRDFNSPQMSSPGQTSQITRTRNSTVTPPFDQPLVPNASMHQGNPQYHVPTQGTFNFNQNNQRMPHGQTQFPSAFNFHQGQLQNQPNYVPRYQSQPLSDQFRGPLEINQSNQGQNPEPGFSSNTTFHGQPPHQASSCQTSLEQPQGTLNLNSGYGSHPQAPLPSAQPGIHQSIQGHNPGSVNPSNTTFHGEPQHQASSSQTNLEQPQGTPNLNSDYGSQSQVSPPSAQPGFHQSVQGQNRGLVYSSNTVFPGEPQNQASSSLTNLEQPQDTPSFYSDYGSQAQVPPLSAQPGINQSVLRQNAPPGYPSGTTFRKQPHHQSNSSPTFSEHAQRTPSFYSGYHSQVESPPPPTQPGIEKSLQGQNPGPGYFSNTTYHGHQQHQARFNPLTGQPQGPTSFNLDYQSQAQSQPPAGQPGIDHFNQRQNFGPGYSSNTMMNQGNQTGLYDMVSSSLQGRPPPHAPALPLDSMRSQNTDQYMSSSMSMYGQQSMMETQMMHSAMLLMQQRDRLDQKAAHYQNIAQQRNLSDVERMDYDQIVKFSAHLSQRSMAMMTGSGYGMGSPYMSPQPMSQPMAGDQRFVPQSQNQMFNPSLEQQQQHQHQHQQQHQQPMMPNSLIPPANQSQPEITQQQTTAKTELPTIVKHQAAVQNQQPISSQPDGTLLASSQAGKMPEKPEQKEAENVPLLNTESSEVPERNSDYITPPESPQPAEVTDQGHENKDERYLEAAEKHRTDMERVNSDGSPKAPNKELNLPGDLSDVEYSYSESNLSTTVGDQSNLAETNRQPELVDDQLNPENTNKHPNTAGTRNHATETHFGLEDDENNKTVNVRHQSQNIGGDKIPLNQGAEISPLDNLPENDYNEDVTTTPSRNEHEEDINRTGSSVDPATNFEHGATLQALEEVHSDLFKRTCKLADDLRSALSNVGRMPQFSTEEENRIRNAHTEMRNKRTESGKKTAQLIKDSEKSNRTRSAKEKTVKLKTEIQNTHLKCFKKWYQHLNELYSRIDAHCSTQNKEYYGYLEIINNSTKQQGSRNAAAKNNQPQHKNIESRHEKQSDATRFMVYISEHFGAVREVKLESHYPPILRYDCEQENPDSRVWVTTLPIHVSEYQNFYYRYLIVDSKGSTPEAGLSRHRYVGQEELRSPIVYDGVALPANQKQDGNFLQKLAHKTLSLFTTGHWRGPEMYLGYSAMAPVTEDLFRGKTSSEICNLLDTVYKHVNRIHQNSTLFKQCVTGYVTEMHEWLNKYVNDEKREWKILISSMIALLWMRIYLSDAIETSEVQAMIVRTHFSLISVREFDTITLDQMSEALGTFEVRFLEVLIKTLSPERSYYSRHNNESRDYTWFILTPLLHAMAIKDLNKYLTKGVKNKLWWGELDYLEQFKSTLKSASVEVNKEGHDRFHEWYGWLQPYFNMDPWAPRTFLAHLSTPAFVKMMNRENPLLNFPLDAFCACFSYHVPTSGNNVEEQFWINLQAVVTHGIQTVAEQEDDSRRVTLYRSGLDSLHEALHKYGEHDNSENKEAMRHAIQPYLTVLNSISELLPEPKAEMKDYLNAVTADAEKAAIRCVHGRRRAGLDEKRIKIWEMLLQDSEKLTFIKQWWTDCIITLFNEELDATTQDDRFSSTIMDRYMDPNVKNKDISAALLDWALRNAEDILKKQTHLKGYRASDQLKKISKIIVHAVQQTWAGMDDTVVSSMDIVKNVLKWKNFVTLYNFIQTLKPDHLPEETRLHMAQAITALHDIVDRLKQGQVTRNEYTTIRDHVDDLVSTCDCNDDHLHREKDSIRDHFNAVDELIVKYDTFKTTIRALISKCSRNFTDGALELHRQISEWLNHMDNDTPISDLFDQSEEVLRPDITPEFRQIASEWKGKQRSRIFSYLFNESLKNLKARSLEDVVGSFRDSDHQSEALLTLIREGRATAIHLRNLKNRMFNNVMESMKEELSKLGIGEDRIAQIDMFEQFETQQKGAETILGVRDALELTGNFEALNIFTLKLNDIRLEQINQEVIEGIELLGNYNISTEKIKCLTVIQIHPEFVKWAREHLPDHEIRTFIGLAHNNIGENDDTAIKIDALMDALSGYSPMIYEMKPETDFIRFMEIVEEVWTACEANEKLPSQLIIAAKELDVWKELKENLNNFEMDVLSQATSINETGDFKIGAILVPCGDSHLKLNDIIELDCKLTRRFTDNNATNAAKAAKYSAERFNSRIDKQFEGFKGSLEELQEKLTLIAGEKQRENEDTIARFDKLRDVVTKLGQTWLDLQREGCILFDDLIIIIHCNPKEESPIELKFAGVNQSLRTKKGEGSVIEDANTLHRFMEKCMGDWEMTLDTARKKHWILNHYTTEQLVTLRRQLAKLFIAAPGDFLEVLQLMRSVAPATKDQLFELGQLYTNANENTDRSTNQEEVDDNVVQEIVDEIMDQDENVNKNQCLHAVKTLGITKPIDEYIYYINNQMKETSADTTISSEIFTSSTTSRSMMDQLKKAWKRFLDMTSSTHEKLLSIDQLVFTLNGILPQDEMVVNRKKPDWLESSKPTLVICNKNEMLQLVLSVYMEDVNAEKPTRAHILVCTKLTTAEEVKIFMLRALSDSASVYCMVNCEILDNSACRVIEEQIFHSFDHRQKGYTICFFCDKDVRDARIRSYLRKYSVHNVDMIKHDTAERCKHYIQTKILSEEQIENSARSVDNDRLACRVVRSDLAGAGKTLHCTRIREKDPGANYVIIPIYRKPDIDAIVSQLHNRCKPEPASNIIHIDISYEVESGVDDILMNLIVLGSICSSRGVVWHRNERDYYLIESMPFKKLGKNVHYLLDLLPTIMCKPPTDSKNNPIPGTSLDSEILDTDEWQIVLKFLQKYDAQDQKYQLQPKAFTDKTEAMRLIVKHCKLPRPSWSELTYFVRFLSSQLNKVESKESIYCKQNDGILTGFRKFVVDFMIIMAQDFATRSLKISEESPGLTLNEIAERSGGQRGGMLEMLTVKHTWENANHPYLFFNEDSVTFSFIGFVVSSGGRIIDPETSRRFENYPVIPRPLKDELLHNYNVNLTSPFNNYSKQEKLDKMQQIMVKDPHLYRCNANQITDPSENYELTLDNVKKILAIHQRIRVGIPVIVMGDTGCGKTKLIDYASKLQVPEELRQTENDSADDEKITNMIIMKVHGGTTEEDIIHYVNKAQRTAHENQKKCEAYARKRGWVKIEEDQEVLYNVPTVYTVLFLDEANTTEAIGLVKEILCDRRMLGVPLDLCSELKIVAACNPYRKHDESMIEKLRKAGLGYFVDENEITDKFAGHIPMRHLVYRVRALSQSLLPLVWDFGTVRDRVERQYIGQMIQNAERNRNLHFGSKIEEIVQIIAVTHTFMRKQKDECSFVSLRDVDRLLEITQWFQKMSPEIYPLIAKKIREEDDLLTSDGYGHEVENEEERNYMSNEVVNSLLLAIGVCYLARLEEGTRERYSEEINLCIRDLLISDDYLDLPDGAKHFDTLLRRCQDVIIDEVVQEVTKEGLEDRGSAKHTNIAKNKALKENVFMMIICIENRIPLFLVGKPGSSKSLSKAMVFDALVGRKARSQLIQRFKETYMVSFQCSRLATPNSIVSVFHEGAERQKTRNIEQFVSIVVLDEVGLAEDSENMPLKTLHPLLEDGCEGHEKWEKWKKCAFVGISNWALDPAKMNRGIFVQRGTPKNTELMDIASGICKGADATILDEVNQVLQHLVDGYLAVCKAHKPSSRKLTEFFGLRDFYSLVKMVLRFAQYTEQLYRSQIIHAIMRNFGGFDPQRVDCLKEFRKKFQGLDSWPELYENKPPTDPMDLVKCGITNDVKALNGMESRYLLVLTENLSILTLISNKLQSVSSSANSPDYREPEIIFGSHFKRDIHFTKVCHDINLIKNCMASGTPVILLNLDDLYESLYDTLNQYFSPIGDSRLVGLGLGTHRVNAVVHNDFRLVVIADSEKVYKQFPIPLINRLEKHYISMNSLLNQQQKKVKKYLERWAKLYNTPDQRFRKQADPECVCSTEMYLPYMLPCSQHHIGACCKDKISLGQLPRECPRCRQENISEPIPKEWEWEVDRPAKENRDYFERSTGLDTSFIGYSNEMLALIVIQSTPNSDKEEATQLQILETAKKHLLQIATADSVLRVGNTKLLKDRELVQRIYFQEQKHENLYSYLNDAVRQERNHSDNNEQITRLFIQVTTFARLLLSTDMDYIQEMMAGNVRSFNKECFTINDFDTEVEFTDKLRKFYSECHNYQKCLLVLQCESADTKPELLDSVRFLVHREKKQIQSTDFEEHAVITVLVLNLPRGLPFSCYQGEPWKCVHIDDPGCSTLKAPSLLQCLKMKPSEIIEHVIGGVKSQTGQLDGDMRSGIGEVGPINNETVSVESIIVPALPKVLSAIDGHDQMSYKIIRDILKNSADPASITQDVVKVWLEYTQNLLRESEERNTRYNWVTSHAAKAVMMKRNETVRSSLETSLQTEIRPALAAVLAQCEPYNNLLLLADDSASKRKFWLELMEACFTTKLNYADITTSDEKLPERFRASGNLGASRFNCNFPFSWNVFEMINEMLIQHSSDEAERLFAEMPVGRVINKFFEINNRSEGSFKDWAFGRYISDFVHLSQSTHSNQEHELVCRSIIAMMTRSTDEDNQINSLVSIHVLFNRYSEHYSKLSVIINVTLGWRFPVSNEGTLLNSAVCSKLVQEEEVDNLSKYPCHLLVLMKTMSLVRKIPLKDFKQDFSGYVSMISSLDGLFKDYILQMDHDEECEEFIPYEFLEEFKRKRTDCLFIRHQLILRKNYVQHVVLKLNPRVIDHTNIQTDQLSNMSRACTNLKECKEYDDFKKVVEVLELSLVNQTSKVFGCNKKCPRCENPFISPVKLPCTHLVCLACTQSVTWFCPEKDCGIQITEVNYDPSTDEQLNKDNLAALAIQRTYLNEFFMTFVSDVVFHPEFENSKHKEPSKEVIEYLVSCITSQNGTRKFSIFNAQDVIDQKNPVVRTFLLKLLLHVALGDDYDDEYNPEEENQRTEFVAASKLIEFINRPTHEAYAEMRAQTIALVIDCIKDHLTADTDKLVDYNSPDITMEKVAAQFEDADWFKEVTALSLNHLKYTARAHIVLERTVLHILSAEEQKAELNGYLKTYLDRLEIVSEQPKLFICRLINDHCGEGKLLDIKHSPHLSFLLPRCIHSALIQTQVVDHLAIEADASYKDAINLLDRVLTDREEQLNESINELNQMTNIQVLLHAMFTRVARFFTTQHKPSENRVNQIRQLLQIKFTQHHDSMWFESMLTNNVLGGSPSLESSEGAQIFMLALRTFTTLREGQGLLAPLTNILNNVSSCGMLYLPTMPDNPIEEIHATASKVLIAEDGENPTLYTCPNGHAYYIGDCGRPWFKDKCPECRAVIGGSSHEASAGNTAVENIQQYKTLPGYLEDAAIREPVAERDLSVLSLTVTRCLLHVCLLTASATNREQVNALIGRGKSSAFHLITRIKGDVRHLSNSLGTNQERVMILLHLTLHRMTQIHIGGQYSLADKTSRRTWEATFNDHIIKPLFNQNAATVAEQQQESITDNVGDLSAIILPKPDLKEKNMLDCSYLWIYKRPLNLAAIQKAVSSNNIIEDSLLKKLLNKGARLQLVSSLPEIVTLMKKLSVKFDNKFTQEQSASTNIESFLSENDKDDEFRKLVERYMNVWNKYSKQHNDEEIDESAHIFPITYQSSLLEILPITVSPDNPRGSTYKRILYYLIENHNSFIDESQRTDAGIDVSLVTQSHLVCLPDGSEELVPIIIRHSQYEFGETFERTCDWEKVDEDLGYQYITGRRLINTESINKLPAYHFPNEFTIITLIDKLRDQEFVIRGDKETVMQRLSGYGVNQLNEVSTQLETMIKICSTIRQYDNHEKLGRTFERNFDEKPDWLIDSLEVRHLVSLWIVVKFLLAKAFRKNKQLAFDEIVGQCKKDLDDGYKVEMKEKMASYQSYQTHVLLEHLFQFILFKLNNVTARQEEPLFNQPLSDCMDVYILEAYTDEEEGQKDGRLNVTNCPLPILVSQATATWEYLYHLYSTPVETELERQ